MKLIDVDKLKADIRTRCSECAINGTKFCRKQCTINNICEVIDLQPTVEDIISAKDFKDRLNNMQYVYLQACYEDLIDAIDCELTYFKEKQNHGKK